MNLTGKLILVGADATGLCRAVVQLEQATVAVIEHLPMYQEVEIVPRDKPQPTIRVAAIERGPAPLTYLEELQKNHGNLPPLHALGVACNEVDRVRLENVNLSDASKLLLSDLESYADDFEKSDPEGFAAAKSTHAAVAAGRRALGISNVTVIDPSVISQNVAGGG